MWHVFPNDSLASAFLNVKDLVTVCLLLYVVTSSLFPGQKVEIETENQMK
jgi:hypothetical protein